jgi:multicomponent Na+:H+ antiporter subunit G
MNPVLESILDVVAIAFLIFGLFFMSVGALGVVRLPDFFNRMHAATKCVTLGISGLLIGGGIILATHAHANPIMILTTISLVIIFQFIASPVGAHMLGRAAHLDGCPMWDKTLSDELAEDRNKVGGDNR